MQLTLPITYKFRDDLFDLVKKDYAKIDELKEARRAEYYKRRNAGLKGEITKLKKQLKGK